MTNDEQNGFDKPYVAFDKLTKHFAYVLYIHIYIQEFLIEFNT